MKNKTVHIIYSGLGGHFDYVFNLAQGMDANTNTHFLFFGVEPVPDYYLAQCQTAGISYSKVLKTGYGFKATVQILKVLRKQKPALIYVHSNAAAVPARLYLFLRKAKLVMIEHHNNRLKTVKDHRRTVYAQRKFDRIIFLTKTHLDEARKNLQNDFNESKSVVIQTGLPAAYFNAPVQRKPGKAIIGMQSRLVPIKDHQTLICAFKGVVEKHPETELRIAGDGTEIERLKKLTADLELSTHVHFEGMLPKTALIDWLGKLTVYVHATLGETSSIALMEALAQGLPIVASDVMGINDFLSSETAILVPPKNADMLQDAISLLLADEKKRSDLSENAFNFAVANCSLQKMSAAYQQLEKDILK